MASPFDYFNVGQGYGPAKNSATGNVSVAGPSGPNGELNKIRDPFNLTGMNDDTSWRDQQNYYRNLMAKPTELQYQGVYDPGSMSVAPGVQQALAQINPDPRALNALRSEALRTGPSNWANLSMARQDLTDQNAREQARKMGAGQAAEGASRLAMSGGLSSGARERLQKSAAQGALEQSQAIGRQGDLARQGINVQDESNRMGLLQAQPGAEIQNANFDLSKLGQGTQAREYDVNQLVNEGDRRNQFNLGQYNTQMGSWAANQQAAAIAAGGKKGSLLGMGQNGGKK